MIKCTKWPAVNYNRESHRGEHDQMKMELLYSSCYKKLLQWTVATQSTCVSFAHDTKIIWMMTGLCGERTSALNASPSAAMLP